MSDSLPIIWDADFLYGPRDAAGEHLRALRDQCQLRISLPLQVPQKSLASRGNGYVIQGGFQFPSPNRRPGASIRSRARSCYRLTSSSVAADLRCQSADEIGVGAVARLSQSAFLDLSSRLTNGRGFGCSRRMGKRSPHEATC